MCSRSPYHMAEWPMGALPPIISMKVVSAHIGIPSDGVPTKTLSWDIPDGERLSITRLVGVSPADVVKRFIRPMTVGSLVTRDTLGEVSWRLSASRAGVFATQVNPVNPETGKREWYHFLDSMNQDVTPYVHAAVARLGARLLGVEVRRPPVNPDAQCLTCKGFRRLPGPDQVLGDAGGRVPSVSTIRMRDEGPWQAEAYWCLVRRETPPDVVSLIERYNEVARHGYPDPVLPLHQAGGACEFYLPKNAGRRGGIPLWEIPAGYADEPYMEQSDGMRTLRVRGAQWEVSLSLKWSGAAIPERPQRQEWKLPESITVKVPRTGQVFTFPLSEEGDVDKGVLSYRAPMVRAALEAAPGEEFTVPAPGGSYRLVRIA